MFTTIFATPVNKVTFCSVDLPLMSNQAVTNYASNTPFITSPLRAGQCNGAPTSTRAPFDMYAYQCQSAAGGGCQTVNQFTYSADTPLFFSAQQCAQQCGGAATTMYAPGKALL